MSVQTAQCPVCEMSGQGCRVGGNGVAVCYICQADIINRHRLIRQGLDGGCVYERIAGPSAEDRPPVERELDAMPLEPVPASELGSGPEISWHWHGYLAPGFTTLLTGLWKAGKTTLLAHYLKACERGDSLGTAVSSGNVLLVSEENETLWRRRRDELQIGDHAHFLCRPIPPSPDYPVWLRFVAGLADLVFREGYPVVIIDSLPAFWSARKENDAGEVIRALAPLNKITEAGAALLLTHHPRKGDGGEAQASRGSGALPGFVDVIVELRRFAPGNRLDTRRVLTGYSRLDETPDELVIELTAGGYRNCGTKADATQSDRLDVLRGVLPSEPPGLTDKQVREAWPDSAGIPRPSVKTIRRDLDSDPSVAKAGAGTRGDPTRFWIRDKQDES